MRTSSETKILLGGLALLLCACRNGTPASAAATATSTLAPSTSTTTSSSRTQSLQSAGAFAAQKVRSCMTLHHMTAASEISFSSSTITVFARCSWPPPAWANQDGYSQINATMRPGPYYYEASDANFADYISGPNCHLFKLQYNFSFQGVSSTPPAFEAVAGMVTSEDHPGQPWTGKSQYPYPTKDEVVYLHNLNQMIRSAQCLS